jgi:hypothetical protein
VRGRILRHLTRLGPRNVNQVADQLGLPQRAVSSNIQIRVDAGRVQTHSEKVCRGSEKIGRSTLTEALIAFIEPAPAATHAIKVAMPIGRYTRCEVSATCGLTTPEGVIGFWKCQIHSLPSHPIGGRGKGRNRAIQNAGRCCKAARIAMVKSCPTARCAQSIHPSEWLHGRKLMAF